MPRRPRLVLPGTPLHLIQRGNNRQACFFTDKDNRYYLDWLKEYSDKYGCLVHAYVLMTNHVHLLVTPAETDSVGLMMKSLGQRYVQYINRTYRRSGTLWEGRFKSCIAQNETYVLACYRYIELNPVRALMVDHPAEYPWSSYQTNALGVSSDLITPHEQYLRLGRLPASRRATYQELFRPHVDAKLIEEIREATNGNYVLGSDRFKRQVAATLKRRVERGLPGRPRLDGA